MTTFEPKTNHRPTAARTRIAPDNASAAGPCSLAQAASLPANEDTLRPALLPRPAYRTMVTERQERESCKCRAADLILTRRTRAEDRIEAAAFGVISLGAVLAIAVSFGAAHGLIEQWRSFLTFLESALR